MITVNTEQLDNIELPAGYEPGNDEPYMGPTQLAYFRRRLLEWRESLLEESQRTIAQLQEEDKGLSDVVDRASQESEHTLELRTRDRYRKLLSKIDSALRRIEDGSYGYCEDTGEEIGLQRLRARPIASLTVEAQERRERREHQYVED